MFSILAVVILVAVTILWVLLNYYWQPPTMKTIKNPRESMSLHALVIGINSYASPTLRNLHGAVADAEAFLTYLTRYLNVPRSQITNLRDAMATRKNIIDAIDNLMKNDNVKHGDSIVIFFAGHGTTMRAPAGWETENNMIQCIAPYDYRVDGRRKVHAIADRTLGGLLHNLADAKGNNITVIFDCCHSGSGTRKDDVIDVVDPTRIARGFESLPDEVLADLDQTFWQEEQSRGIAIPAGFSHAGLRSHVLISACGMDETAWEEAGRGLFTSALIKALSQIDINNTTYKDLMKRISIPPKQSPQCEGANSNCCLFSCLAPSSAQKFSVHREGDTYILDAGEAAGITADTQFAVYPPFGNGSSKLGMLRSELGLIKPFQSELVRLEPAHPHFAIPPYSIAIPTRTGERQALRLHVFMQPALLPVIQPLVQQCAIVCVDQDEADLSMALDASGKVEFKMGAKFGFGSTRLHDTLPPHVDVQPVMTAAAHFFWHLRREPSNRLLRGDVGLSFHKLVYEGPFLQASEVNLIADDVVDIEVDETKYGMTIEKKSSGELYVSVFYFDCSDLSIRDWYMPSTSTSNSKVDSPLSPKNSISIGYGASPSPPCRFSLEPNQTLDVGYVKLFISTRDIDLSGIPQPTPFPNASEQASDNADKPRDDARHFVPVPKESLSMWDVITVKVIQRAKGTKEKMVPSVP